jgi:carboxymethylenebutenolidase
VPTTTQSVSFQGERQRLRAYLARPAEPGDGPFPGVVIIHEAPGLNENIQEISRRFADAGYAALAVDLFTGRSRVVCMARFMGGMLRGTPERFGIGDLKAALSVLAQQPSIDGGRIGAVGFCMGGSFAIAWACTDERLKAIAPFYSLNPRPLTAVARSCPVVGSYPEQDFTARPGRRLDAELERQGVPRDIKVYEGTRHSFFNDGGRTYDPTAAEDAWLRILAFFDEHVAGRTSPSP